MATQTPEELRHHLEEQLGFLKTSAELFDKGNRAEAKRLALGVRVLLHDTAQSHSLLGQLGLKELKFLDTASPKPETVKTSYAGLVGTSFMSGPSECVPHLDTGAKNFLPFDQWWNAPIIADSQQRQITRRHLILNITNKDGGAHVDPELDEIYAGVSRGNAMGRMRNSGEGWEAIPGLEHASARQIAHEVIMSLDPNYKPVPVEKPGHLVVGDFKIGVGSGDAPRFRKVGRNDLCPCGSGTKYKRCHGR